MVINEQATSPFPSGEFDAFWKVMTVHLTVWTVQIRHRHAENTSQHNNFFVNLLIEKLVTLLTLCGEGICGMNDK